jgi:hypothetical protein
MKLRLEISVESDDGKAASRTVNQLALATDTPGFDPDAAKQDFLQQADGLVRTVVENQLPALYDTVDKEAAAARAEEAASESKAKLQAKIQAVKKRRAEKEAQAQQEKAADIVKCTDCGAEIPNDDAHYVTVVNGGRLDRDAVLCDKCYDKVMAEARSESAGPGDGEGE